MSQTVISEIILTTTAIAMSTFLALSIISSSSSFDYLFKTNERKMKDRILTDIMIIFGINDTENSVKIWVKNIGINEVHQSLIPKSDIFFGPKGNFTRIPYEDKTTSTPMWNYTIANDDGDGNWDPGETLEINIIWGSVLSPGEYFVKFILYNGVSDDYIFSI